MRTCVFGDSIAWGMQDTEAGGWADRLKVNLLKKCDARQDKFFTVFNFGNVGEISSKLLDHIEYELDAWLDTESKKANLIIIGIGANDSVLLNDKDQWVPLNQFKHNIEKIVEICKKFADKIILISILPVVESVSTPIPENTAYYHRNLSIQKYNNILRKISEEKTVYFLDLYAEWIKTDYAKLISDGIHPNSAGHKKIYDAVIDFLNKNRLVKD